MESLEKKKVLFIITKSNWGGAQSYVYTLAVHMAQMGAEVVVALGGTGLPNAETGLLAKRLEQANLRTITLQTFARDISIMREFKALAEVRAILKKEQPDILHLNSSKAGGLGALAGKLEHVHRIIFTAHGWAFREPRPFIKKQLIWFGSWLTCIFSDMVIVVSRADYRDAPIKNQKKLTLIHNGVADFSLLSSTEARDSLKEQYGIPEAETWFLMQSELHKNKGVDVAIRAFANIAKITGEKNSDAVLVVLGEGEERKNLEALIAENNLSEKVFLPGFVADSKKFLKAGTIFLMPSYKEGLPMAILEAGYAQLPVIASRTGGIPEIIEQQKNGLLTRPGNVLELTDAMESLQSNEEKRETFRTKLKEKISAQFNVEKMFQKTVRTYFS